MLELLCSDCDSCAGGAHSVVRGRRCPGHGTVAYTCFKCGSPQALFIDSDAVLILLLAGATLVEERARRPERAAE